MLMGYTDGYCSQATVDGLRVQLQNTQADLAQALSDAEVHKKRTQEVAAKLDKGEKVDMQQLMKLNAELKAKSDEDCTRWYSEKTSLIVSNNFIYSCLLPPWIIVNFR